MEQGSPVRKVQTTCGRAQRQETSKGCGGEALRPGRIGEAGRDLAEPLNKKHANTHALAVNLPMLQNLDKSKGLQQKTQKLARKVWKMDPQLEQKVGEKF